jgi:hypothetical protein
LSPHPKEAGILFFGGKLKSDEVPVNDTTCIFRDINLKLINRDLCHAEEAQGRSDLRFVAFFEHLEKEDKHGETVQQMTGEAHERALLRGYNITALDAHTTLSS